ncbi:hypothetical protein ABZX40_15010 [Streptomyces sp. NPDC004610]|uniref:hypothetical protein n=1 Tax=unclassified Streptomyces TaxID=2593676 RepID=UPI0033A90A91
MAAAAPGGAVEPRAGGDGGSGRGQHDRGHRCGRDLALGLRGCGSGTGLSGDEATSWITPRSGRVRRKVASTDGDQAVTPGQVWEGMPRMVNARTHPLGRDLAMSEDLPEEALKTVIEALCAPATTPDGFDVQADRWREEALKDALPALLARTPARRLRGRLLVHADEKTLAALAADGTVTAADVPRHPAAPPGLGRADLRTGTAPRPDRGGQRAPAPPPPA